MLYIKLFFNVLIKNPVKGVAFIALGFSLSFLLGQTDRVQSNVLNSLPRMGDAPHFFALVDNKINSESIRRKLMNLPGVKGVRNISGAKIQAQLKEVLGDVGVDLESMEAPSVTGLKVSFAPKLEIRSQKLIKKYLARLTGDEKVTMGPTIGEEKKTNQWLNSFKDSFKLKVGTLIVTLAALLYLVFGIGIGSELGKEAYLVERFSRRKNVIEVAAGLGFLALTVLMLAPVFAFDSVNYLGVGLFFALTLVTYIVTTRRGWRTA